MIILDNMALNHLVERGIATDLVCFVTFDVRAEFEAMYGSQLPRNVRDVWETDELDKAAYLRNYKEMLNKHGGRSFYNMTGFGDISILALVKTTLASQAYTLLPEPTTVVTSDQPLIKRIRREFPKGDSADSPTVTIADPVSFWNQAAR